jgi:hypothetical protein
MELYDSYLELLRQLTGDLDQLSELAREKIDAVRHDDLDQLDHVLRQEQAMSLSMRSLEAKRKQLLEELKLDKVPLSNLADQYPTESRLEARKTVAALRDQYQLYQGVSKAARATLECNLHEVEAALKDMEKDGWEPTRPVELPKQMRTDIRI